MARVAELSAEVTAETSDFERGMSNVEKAVLGTRTTLYKLDKDIGVFGKNIGSAADALSGMGISVPLSPLHAMGMAVGFVGSQLKAAVNDTVEYAAQVRNLGRDIGATAEETSMLIQAADDVKVSYESLSAALRAAIRNGVEPSIDGIGRLADEYNSIQNPIAKTKFLMDNFGRSGADLAPLMEQGAAGIREMGEAAREVGLVMSEEAVQAAREYEIAVDDLGDAWGGFTTRVGNKTIPMLTQLLKSTEAGYGSAKVMGTTVEEMAEKLEPAERALANVSQMTDMFTGSQNASTEAQDQATRSAHYWTAEMWRAREAIAAMSGATDEAAGGFDRFSDAMTDAALSGVMQGAQEDYLAVIEETTPAMADLRAEIEKYQRQQGTSVTVTGEATTTINEYELGALKAAAAAQKLAEFTGDDALELAQLRVNADHAAENVVKLGEGMGWSATVTADYTKKLQELHGDLATLEAAQADAEAALRKTTAEFVLQQAASSLTGQALLDFAHKTGLMDDASYNLAGRVQFLTGVWDQNKNGVIDLGTEMNGLAAALALETENTVKSTTASAESQPVHAETSVKLDAVRQAAEDAGQAVLSMPASVKPIDTVQAGYNLLYLVDASNQATSAINNIPTHVSVTTDYYENHHGPSTPGERGNYASGGDFIVPPGYPHDSYPMRVQSGEHVVVTPAGGTNSGQGGNGNTYNFVFNNPQPITIPTALQTAKATADAW